MEVNVYVFLIWMKCGVGGVEDEMILIWSGGDVVSGWLGLDVVDGIVGVESEVSWISAWTAAMLVTPVAGLMKSEELDPRVWMELAVVEQDWGQAVMVLP